MEAKLQEQFEDQIAFDKEFSSKDNVKQVKRDQLKLRDRMTEVLGVMSATKGLSENSTVFFRNKRSPVSKIFYKLMPEMERLAK